MNREQLKERLDRLGAPGADWSDSDRRAAAELARIDTESAQLLAAAQRLDAQFKAASANNPATPTPASSALKERILAAAREQSIPETAGTAPSKPSTLERFNSWWSQNLWRPALAACVPLVLGLSLGAVHAQEEQNSFTAQYASDLFSPLDEDAAQNSSTWLEEDLQ